MTHWLIFVEFTALALAIGVSGYFLSLYGDVIAEKTGWGGTWIGIALLATVTSLPELVTGISAVTYVNVPNIALGDVLGSCVFNLLLIVLLDFLHRGASVYTRISQGHILSAGFGVVLLGFVAFNLVLYQHGINLSFWHVGIYSPIIVLFYIFAMRTVFRYEKAQRQEVVEEIAERYPKISLLKALTFFILVSVVVVLAGIRLPVTAEHLAEAMGWRRSFVGTVFVATATSLPEVAVTLSALRIGALDMAISDLLGSNLFDLVIIAVDDMAYLQGPLLASVSPVHLVTSQSAIMMTGIAVVGLLYRPQQRLFKTVGWVSLSMFIIYILNLSVLYLQQE
ncbi:sodium:calcium antiporter [Methylobacter sp. Wu8]|uniref:Cation:H+ antiporter n=1 Tax=Methylobacter tundripaludum TaxID=173365 RepID=A0A2S6H8P3_9GAMM|nr:cation transporter [Methylobacter tundripaludum]MCF7967052.1 sodium:calcium antiporter [Methylobacter tundripaludum]MCK9636994.1 sodium:calcium antiporter [Methylobacter tundripaludum]PPK73838.1 cation:H+ antiporter [Methylobacter tundripaludum]